MGTCLPEMHGRNQTGCMFLVVKVDARLQLLENNLEQVANNLLNGTTNSRANPVVYTSGDDQVL